MNAGLLANALIASWGGFLGVFLAHAAIGTIARTWKAHDFRIGSYLIFLPFYALLLAGVVVDYLNDRILIDVDDYRDQLGMAVEVFLLSFLPALLFLAATRNHRKRLRTMGDEDN